MINIGLIIIIIDNKKVIDSKMISLSIDPNYKCKKSYKNSPVNFNMVRNLAPGHDVLFSMKQREEASLSIFIHIYLMCMCVVNFYSNT